MNKVVLLILCATILGVALATNHRYNNRYNNKYRSYRYRPVGHAYKKVNGGWSKWGHYSSCSAKCGSGYKSRARTCTYPVPAYGGHDCYGKAKETVKCNSYKCKVNGGWTEWGHYSSCSSKCGGGYKARARTCTYPVPAYGGHDCYGKAKETVKCNIHKCKVNGGWTEWGHYSSCSAKCGGGYKSRTRSCTYPVAAYGGHECYGKAKENVKCNIHKCKGYRY